MRIISGVQSSGKLHLGNYFGAIKQFIELQHQGEAFYFIANLHALTTVREGARLRDLTHAVALDFLALGLDPEKATLFRQSDVPEVTELFWILSALTPLGLLERAHSFKDKTARGITADLGLFSYPVLMAADILIYGADVVPVGRDQVQHLEMTRDIATKFNLAFVPGWDAKDPAGLKNGLPGILKLPRAMVQDASAAVPGIDGQKMSKSYGNAIDLFDADAPTKKRIMSIKSDSTALEAPKDRDATPIHALLKLFASPADMDQIDRSFDEGGRGWGHYKQQLAELFFATFSEARKRRIELAADGAFVERVLANGAHRARAAAAPIMMQVREATGIVAATR